MSEISIHYEAAATSRALFIELQCSVVKHNIALAKAMVLIRGRLTKLYNSKSPEWQNSEEGVILVERCKQIDEFKEALSDLVEDII